MRCAQPRTPCGRLSRARTPLPLASSRPSPSEQPRSSAVGSGRLAYAAEEHPASFGGNESLSWSRPSVRSSTPSPASAPEPGSARVASRCPTASDRKKRTGPASARPSAPVLKRGLRRGLSRGRSAPWPLSPWTERKGRSFAASSPPTSPRTFRATSTATCSVGVERTIVRVRRRRSRRPGGTASRERGGRTGTTRPVCSAVASATSSAARSSRGRRIRRTRRSGSRSRPRSTAVRTAPMQRGQGRRSTPTSKPRSTGSIARATSARL